MSCIAYIYHNTIGEMYFVFIYINKLTWDVLVLAAFLTQTISLDDTTVKFEIWDTAGQGIS